MSIPSFTPIWQGKTRIPPRIQVLEVRPRHAPTGEPIAWILVERTETEKLDACGKDVETATIRLSYERISDESTGRAAARGEFTGGYSQVFKTVMFGSTSVMQTGAIFLDLPGLEGQRIGTYLLDQIVTWAKRWPDAEVRPIRLLSMQATRANTPRRNRFYEQFGLVFDYRDEAHAEGRSKPVPVWALESVDAWKQNITEWSIPDYLAHTSATARHAAMLAESRARAIRDLSAYHRQVAAAPLRSAVAPLVARYRDWLLLWALIAAFAGMVWLR